VLWAVITAYDPFQMEQHLYTYLNQKYGLKSLIVEHASAVIRASNKYEAVDNDVAVFVKMLRYGPRLCGWCSSSCHTLV
jgi:hypothetical protein